jgi:dienelactone hydrolase
MGWAEADLARVTRGVRSMAEWAAAWEREADRHVAAGDPWRAATAYYIAGRALLRPTPLRDRLYRRAVACYRVVQHRVPLERLEVVTEDAEVGGWLQVPDGPGPRPLVLLLPGVTGVKEELHLHAAPMLARGVAVARIDLPGAGEARGRLRLDGERIVHATLDLLARDSRLAPRPVIAGLSLGGHWALRAAAERQVAGVAAISTAFSMHPHVRRVPSHVWIGLRLGFAVASHAEAFAWAARLDLTDHLPRVTAPVVLCYGDRDALVPVGEMDTIAERLPGEVRRHLYRGEGHIVTGQIADVAGRVLGLVA